MLGSVDSDSSPKLHRPSYRKERRGTIATTESDPGGLSTLSWLDHWNLATDPFAVDQAAYVATTSRVEAVARLVYAIESGARSATIEAPAGMGKSRVLTRALAEARGPSRRVARVDAPGSGVDLLGRLAEALGAPPSSIRDRDSARRAFRDAIKLVAWQGLHAVVVVDDCQDLDAPADRAELERLGHSAPGSRGRLTVIRSGRPVEDGDGFRGDGPGDRRWEVAIDLPPLDRDEAETYIAAKLARAGRPEPAFRRSALTTLHAIAGGVPEGLDRLAGLALMAAAWEGLDAVTPEVVEGVAAECPGLR